MLQCGARANPPPLVCVCSVGGRELLERIISDDYMLTERECVHFMRQITDAVHYMHARHVVHLDLKPDNVLCVSDNGNEIKIIDFGLARKFDPANSLKVSSRTRHSLTLTPAV